MSFEICGKEGWYVKDKNLPLGVILSGDFLQCFKSANFFEAVKGVIYDFCVV